MFQRNEALLTQYYANHPGSQEMLVDFGVVPANPEDRQDWEAEATRFLTALSSGRKYQFQPAMYDGDSGLCPLYRVCLDKGNSQDPKAVDLPSFEQVVQRLCYPEQAVQIHNLVLEIHILGDEGR